MWQPTTASAPQPPSPRRRRWPYVALVVCLVAVTVAAVLVWSWQRGSDGADSATHPRWQPPPQVVVTSSLHAQPVAGWKARVADLGLPTDSRIATATDSAWSQPFVGYLGNSGYLLASSPHPLFPQWWLVGIDSRTGETLFPPVQLDSGVAAPSCVLSGPRAVMCLRDHVQDGVAGSSTAWVIDAQSGTVSFTGPTDLHSSPGALRVVQVGIYAVAATVRQGLYGVGPHAETTWFVPGDGKISQRFIPAADVTPQTLATQVSGGDRMVVFSIVDGKVVNPDLGPNDRPLSAVAYPGGFAVEVVGDEKKSTPDGIAFFDDNGRRLGYTDVSDFLATNSLDVPIVESAPHSTVFTPNGERLAEISRFGPGDSAVLIGTLLFIDRSSAESGSKQYDLQTGTEGKTCDISLVGYLGTDGKVGVFESGNSNVGLVTKGVDLATCDVLWQIESPVGSLRDVWRINTTLVQLSDDGTELMSLVAPR